MTFEAAKRYILNEAKALGLEVEVLATESRTLMLEAQNGKLAETTQATQGGIGVRAVIAGKTGYASSEELTPEALRWVLSEAKENAELQSSTGAALPQSQAFGYHDLISEGLSAPLSDKAAAVTLLESELRKDKRTQQIPFARYTETETQLSLASTQGADGGYRNGYTGIYASVIMRDGESLKQGFDMHFEKEFHTLNPGQTALNILNKTGRLLGAKPLTTCRTTAYFEPKAFAQLLGVLSYMISGKSLTEGKSPLADKLGSAIASSQVTLSDDPTLPGGMASRPFDSEGTPAQALKIIERGIFKSFLHNSATARETGQPNTGHASRSYKSSLGVSPTNLILEPGAGVRPQDGIIITQLSGVHAGANPISGDISLQALGLLVEGGETLHAVENFVISGNLLTVLGNITALGTELEWSLMGPAIATPMVEVADLSFAGA
jgi:PmbA protein